MYKQFFCITHNSFSQIIRKPLYLILCALSVFFIGIFPHLALFTFGEEFKFMTESSLGIFMFLGVWVAVFATHLVCTNEIEKGNLLLLFVKPVSRLCFILAKFKAVVLSLLFLLVLDIVAFFVSHRMLSVVAVNVSEIFVLVTFLYFFAIAVAFFLGALSSYWLRRDFVSDTLFMLLFLFALLFVGLGFVDDTAGLRNFYDGMSFTPVFMFLYLFMAVCVIASFSLLCSLFFGFVPNLVFTFVFLIAGLVWSYFFTSWVSPDLMFLKSLVPDMNYFWVKNIGDADIKSILYQTLYTGAYALSHIGFLVSVTCLGFSFKEINDKGI